MTIRLTRRQFVRQSSALAGTAAAALIVPRHVLGGPRRVAPSDRLDIAGIGIGGMGAANLRNLEAENIVALCDVDPDYASKTIKRYPKARFYSDYREMVDEHKDIDGIVIATPDHTHAVIAMAALRSGKHVFCQKPLTHTVYEARRLSLAAKEAGVATQMGIQGHSAEGVRLICEWVWAGLIGEVREVEAWCELSYYPWGHSAWSSQWSERPVETPSVPPGLEDGRKLPEEGDALLKGSQGTIMAGVYGDSPRIIPESRMREVTLPGKTLPRVEGSHEQDWVKACKTGQPAGADFSYSGPLTEICCLGNIAKRVDTRIEWDAANMKVTNLPEANAYVRREYRQGWEL